MHKDRVAVCGRGAKQSARGEESVLLGGVGGDGGWANG